jgi:hypothetical protein
MRFARRMLQAQLACMAVGAVALVYVLGLRVHPHKIGYAFLIAAAYVFLTGVATVLTQLAWRVQAVRAAATAARGADGVFTTENGGGFAAPRVRQGLRSQRRTWLSVTVLGAAMLIGFLVLVDHYEGPALALESSGVHVEGVISSVIGQRVAPADGAVDVQYTYAGQSFDTHVYRDDTSPLYHLGEAVTVTLDPSDPSVATVGGSDNESPGLVVLLIVLLLGGGVGVLLGPGMLIAMRLTRQRARRATIQADHPA